MNKQTTWEFLVNSSKNIIPFLKSLYGKLTNIKNIDFSSLSTVNTSIPLLFDFLIGLIYVLLIFSFFNYLPLLIRFFIFIFKCIFLALKSFFNLFKKNTIIKNNEKSVKDIEKIKNELLVLRLQNGKLKKQTEKATNIETKIKKTRVVRKVKKDVKK